MLCVVSVTLVSAAGAQTRTPTKKWASGVCSAVQTWIDDVDSTVQGLKGAGSLDAAADQAKTGVQSANEDLATSLDELGRPQSSEGKKVQKSVQKLQQDLDAVGADIQAALADPPSGAVAAAATFAEIGAQLGEAGQAVRSAATALKGLDPGGDLQKAFQSAPSCKKLKTAL